MQGIPANPTLLESKRIFKLITQLGIFNEVKLTSVAWSTSMCCILSDFYNAY